MEVDTTYSVSENSSIQVEPPAIDKLISFKDPRLLLGENWFVLVFEITVYYVLWRAIQHARQKGTQAIFLLLSVICGSLTLEFLQQIPHPGYQLWWYHLGVINLLQHRVPAYIPAFVSLIYYYADYLTRDTKLPLTTRSLVNAFVALLLIFPWLCIAPNFLVLLVHFDDPMFYDRIMNVPFVQITYLFLLFFHLKHVFDPNFNEIETHERHFFRYLRCAVQSGVVSALFSFIEVYLLYVLFKLVLNSNAAICLIFAIATLCCLAKDELLAFNHQGYARSGFIRTFRKKEWPYLVAFFSILLFSTIFVKPENLQSTGERLELGPCDVVHLITNMSPLDIMRKRYICPSETTKFGFDFHCVNVDWMSSEITKEYTICGAPFENPTKLISVLLVYAMGCLAVFHLLLSFSMKTKEETEITKNGKKVD